MTQPVDIEALRALMERATAGPWDIWREPIKDIQDAIDEAMVQVQATDPIIDAMVMLNAGGKCPAMTGCGPTSDANAELIVALRNNAESLLTELEALRAERGRMENGLKVAEDAMREMFRYYDGGETRGSYDGKPERNGLRKAWHEVRSILASLKEPSQ